MPKLTPPRTVLEIAARLEEAGFEAWCVGGAVRDALLGHPHLDWDLATSATPPQVRHLFGSRRTIPVGIDFGTVGVLDAEGTMHEVTTFRRDVKTDGRHAEVEFGVSLDDDLARRDFTINAIAYSPSTDELRDPFGGRADLDRRVVRAVGDAEARMREDRLRALRAIRFASRFEFGIEPTTFAAIRTSAPLLNRLSAERVKQELEKTMDQVRWPSQALSLWAETGALATLVPSLASIDAHTIAALDCLAMPGTEHRPQRRLNRLAVLFLELPDDKRSLALAALKFSRQETSWISELGAAWRSAGAEIEAVARGVDKADDRRVRVWVSGIGRLRIGGFLRVASALWYARASGERSPSETPGKDQRRRLAGEGPIAKDMRSRVQSLYRRMLRSAYRDPLTISDLAIDGEDLQREGIPRGPLLGKILNALLERVLEDPSRNTPDWLLQEAKRLHREWKGESGA
jgi:tRNA nucleotidyltransferase (CCA-adding enzyme)